MTDFSVLAHALEHYEIVLKPDRDVEEWWAGAPSVVVSPEGTFFHAARMREGESPRGKRGYEIRILESADGVHFEPIARIRREDLGVPGVERPALAIDPETGAYRLYGCAGTDQGWFVFRLDDADHPTGFDPATRRTVLSSPVPADTPPTVMGYKDPIVFCDQGTWHMFAIAGDRVERVGHFTSPDGEAWTPSGPQPVMENSGWHNFYTRPASILPLRVGYLFVYEGSNVSWHDPVYNIATGIAYTADLVHVTDLTPSRPLLKSTTPGAFHTWRYSQWLVHGGKLFVYFEAANPNDTNELRVAVLDADTPGIDVS